MKQGSLFCFVMLRSAKLQHFLPGSLVALVSSEDKLSMSKGASTWFHTVLKLQGGSF